MKHTELYDEIYHYDYYLQGGLSGIDYWKQKKLKFQDNVSALVYSFGITWDKMVKHFPLYDQENTYTVFDVINFLNSEAKRRQPNRILEIGGGRGEIACILSYMGIPHLSVEVFNQAGEIYQKTANQYFGNDFQVQKPMVGAIENLLKENRINLNDYDTIIFSESVEHIIKENLEYVIDRISKEFTGRFIITNDKDYHPIYGWMDHPEDIPTLTYLQENLSTTWPYCPDHVTDINDEVYARWTKKAKKLIYKDGSHLILEFEERFNYY